MKPLYTDANHLVLSTLHLEDYDAFYNDPSTPALTVLQLNQVVHLHGFSIHRENRRKDKFLEALSEISNLLNPTRSTLNETFSSTDPCITVDEVNADLTALNWLEGFPIERLESISFTPDRNTDVNDIQENKQKKRGRKRRVRKVCDADHVKKPRSKKRVKRKRLSDIINSDHISHSLG